jgi:putative long chain acyl-CoA synthase
VAAFVLGNGRLDLAAIADAVALLPENAQPRFLRRVDAIPMTDGYRPLKKPIRDLGFAAGPDVYAWDPATRRYRPHR